jgi:hypothetical protein
VKSYIYPSDETVSNIRLPSVQERENNMAWEYAHINIIRLLMYTDKMGKAIDT